MAVGLGDWVVQVVAVGLTVLHAVALLLSEAVCEDVGESVVLCVALAACESVAQLLGEELRDPVVLVL